MKYILALFFLLITSLGSAETAELYHLKVQSLALSGQKKHAGHMAVHDAVRALKPKLSKLPYKNCDLVWDQNISVPMKSRQKFSLSNGDQLELELLYIEDQRVGLWIDWRDKGGVDLLDTRLHFDTNETMLAGAEEEDAADRAKMLAISIVHKDD